MFIKYQRNLLNLRRKCFSEFKWIPKVPNHKIILDKDHYHQPHAAWDIESAEKVQITHIEAKTFRDRLAYYIMKFMRTSFDFFTGYKHGKMNEVKYLRRVIFLETIAGVPGMIGAIARHLRSLRGLKEDGGWIHHLLEEAENERMHLLFFLRMRRPGFLMRLSIMYAQFVFIFYYSFLYTVSPTTAHRFVGYLEEEAVKTYTGIIEDLDKGLLPECKDMSADEISIRYWALPKDAKIRDVLIAIRADEVSHREYNHHFADTPKDKPIEKHDKIHFIDEKNMNDLFKYK